MRRVQMDNKLYKHKVELEKQVETLTHLVRYQIEKIKHEQSSLSDLQKERIALQLELYSLNMEMGVSNSNMPIITCN